MFPDKRRKHYQKKLTEPLFIKTENAYCVSERSEKIKEEKMSWQDCKKKCSEDPACKYYAAMKLKQDSSEYCVRYKTCGGQAKHNHHTGDLYAKGGATVLTIVDINMQDT